MSTLQEKSTCTHHIPIINRVVEASDLKINNEPSASFESANSEFNSVKEKPFVVNDNSTYYSDSIEENHFDPRLACNKAQPTFIRSSEQPFLHSLPNNEETFQEIKIDIHDHLLKEESLLEPSQLKGSTNSRKVLLQDLVNSLDVLCDICDKKIQRVIKLNKQESLTAAVILEKGLSLGLKRKRIFSRKIPVQSCGRCFTRIVLFRLRFEEKLLRRQVKEETEMNPPWNHGIDCPCPTCQNQYGSLGLIVRGMETLSSQASFQNLPQPQNVSVLDGNRAIQSRPEQGDFSLFESGSECDNIPVTDVAHPADCYNIPVTVPITISRVYEQQHFEAYSGSTEIHSTTVESRQQLYSHPASSSNIQEQSEDKPYSLYNTSPSETGLEARESTLPLTLQDFEDRTRPDLAQPSTSRGFPENTDERSLTKSKRVCIHCQKQFNHTGDFRKHLRKHTKEKPYACRLCDKRFSHTSNLHRHERSHTGARPHRCEFCNKEFNRKDKLDSHKKSKSCKNRRQEGTN